MIAGLGFTAIMFRLQADQCIPESEAACVIENPELINFLGLPEAVIPQLSRQDFPVQYDHMIIIFVDMPAKHHAHHVKSFIDRKLVL